jgi:hypothetical protein
MYCRFCTGKRKVCDDFKNPSLEEIGASIKVPVDLGYADGLSEDKKGGTLTSAIGLGKVYVNDPIERIEGKPVRHNPNRK